jgi:hypothetical protein
MFRVIDRWLIIGTLAFALSGCSKPDRVAEVKLPLQGLSLLIERYNGDGPASSDFTRVYARLERNGETDKKLIIDGEYVNISKVSWRDPGILSLCASDGITNAFHNEVVLRADGDSEKVHTIFHEHC